MKVLYLINSAGAGGSERYVELLAKHIQKKKDVAYVVYNEKGPLIEKLPDVKMIQLKMKSPFDFKAAKALSKLCKREQIDVVHSQFARENYIAILSKLWGNKARMIYTSHIHIFNTSIWKLTNRIMIPHNDRVIAVCESVKKLLIKNNYPKNKIEVIYNGTSVIDKKSQGTEIKPVVFTTFARLSEEKGLEFLVDAALQLKKANISFEMNIAGDGPLKTSLEQKISENGLDEVKLLGYVTDTIGLLEKSHVYINSSSSEALSFGIIEAMSLGMPIIATHVGGNVEIIEKTVCGVLVPYDDTEAMYQAMKQIVSNNEQFERFSVNAKQGVEAIFNLDKVMAQTYQLYRETLEEK